ncbi:alcohol dehydrogenase catalytic domain-containing protein [Mechercharimyces sp. CAU 1602]|uniref:alcohol dehydrogenase catalytic domain-containing protein n=1 Tax=Mechercharimyces sp. CAU 1602 TaxID=2973933 RepID=UPI0021623F1D|nr:alcohol dehydrogenase catalytic domain-containing protein [Mechercharimyces sp. CAU 1602]MCS1351826.1 alcohol dehydrogenase catalytic domain-containing protein [Mechercharimyces sp. CAU 1602]
MKSKKVMLYLPEKLRVEEVEIKKKGIIVKPSYLSVCNADLRYYYGDRPSEVLKKKLPLVLIHEAVGNVVYSDDPAFVEGDNVAIVPISRHVSPLAEEYNYDYPGSTFMSSSVDGCMQTLLPLTGENLVKFNDIEPQHGTVIEVATIAMQAVKRLKRFYNRQPQKIAVWGTGSVAFWTALLLREAMPTAHITVIGRSPNKLEAFSFVDETILHQDMDYKNEFDLVVEAVGGYGTQTVMTNAIDLVKPVGCILMLGVSEQEINVNTRGWMEKGIIILTSHRSTYDDFKDVVDMIESSSLVKENLHKSVSYIQHVQQVEDIHEAFNQAGKHQFKTVMKWDLC